MMLRHNPWAILDTCIIQKGEGHYDFNTLIEQLVGLTGQGGLESFPRPMGDIGGGALSGVEADAVWEAIYQGAVDPTTAAIIHAGPQPGQEGLYQQALQQAITAGAGTINAAVNAQNAIWDAKRQELIMSGKDPSKIPEPLPVPFESDMGRTTLNAEWKGGVFAAQNKDTPWEYDQFGQRQLRIGNRDQENKFAESWNRPYHEGLQQMRGGRKTREYIESHRVQPNSVFITHEAGKHIYDMMDSLARQGYNRENLTPEMVKQFWAAHPVLAQYMPHQMSPLSRSYNIRNTSPHQPQEADAAQAAVEQQNQQYRATDYSNYLPEGALESKRGVSFINGAYSNSRAYLPKIYNAYDEQYKLQENGLSMEDALARGQGRHVVDRLTNGIIQFINEQNPGIVPEHIQDPSQLIRPQARPAQQPEAPPEEPAVERQVQPPAPPVRVEPPAPPVPVQREPEAPPVPVEPQQAPPPPPQRQPAIPPRMPEMPPNLDTLAPTPEQQADMGQSYSSGWRGMSERLAESLGRGAGRFMNLFGKEEIAQALESVQEEIALNNMAISKAMPTTSYSPNSARDIGMMAARYNIPPSDVVTILNSRGHWEEISKSMGVDYELFQLVKVAFK
jgi:phage tail protein X/outer membrane biosynthesis protein TonB